MHWKFKEAHTLEQRKKESRQILQKYPDRIPVVVQRAPKSNLVDLDKHKFLVPFEVTIAQFMWILRQRLTLSPNKAIYLFVNRTLPQACALIGELYQQFRDEDGFIYIMYSGENTFGAEDLIGDGADPLTELRSVPEQEHEEHDRKIEMYSNRPVCVLPGGME